VGRTELSQVVGVVEGKIVVHSHNPKHQKVGLRMRRAGCKQGRERKVNLGESGEMILLLIETVN